MTVLVTSGGSFIRDHFGENFLRAGRDLTSLDSRHSYYDMRIKDCTLDRYCEPAEREGQNYELVGGDVRDAALVDELIEDADYIYHQAARPAMRDSVAEARTYDDVNVDGTLNIFNAPPAVVRRVWVDGAGPVQRGLEREFPITMPQ